MFDENKNIDLCGVIEVSLKDVIFTSCISVMKCVSSYVLLLCYKYNT